MEIRLVDLKNVCGVNIEGVEMGDVLRIEYKSSLDFVLYPIYKDWYGLYFDKTNIRMDTPSEFIFHKNLASKDKSIFDKTKICELTKEPCYFGCLKNCHLKG